MIINGIYDKTLYRDEKYGDTIFTIIPGTNKDIVGDFGNIVCKGVVPRYPTNIPLKLNLSKIDSESYGVWGCNATSFDREHTYNFLTSDYFNGIGPAKADKYLDKYGIDIFHNDYVEDFGIIYDKVSPIKIFERLYSLISGFGGTYHHAYRLFKRHGIRSIDVIKENPYILSDVIPFDVVDTFAFSENIDVFDERRINGIITEGLKKISAQGNTCVSFEEFNKIVSRIDNRINPVYIAGTVLSDKRYYCDKDDFNIYDSQLYMSEENAAFNVARLQNGKTFFGDIKEDVISEIEKEENTNYETEQKRAFNILESSGVKVITGGPGTGKTTVINGLIKYIKKVYPEKTIALAAPTANAAKRIREKTGEDATTLHKLLEITPFANSDNFAFKNIYEDVVIIDESSFIDTRLASIIFQSVKKDVTLILVGDVDQLPSVGPGKVFRDLIDSDCLEVIRLNQIFRQSEGSVIIENAVRIKNGNDNLLSGEDFEIRNFSSEQEIFDTAVELMKKYYDKENPYSVRLYTPVRKRKYKCCTHSFNKELQEYFSDKGDYFVYGYTKFYVGDPVIFTRNNYSSGYCNGDEGKIVKILENDDGKYGVLVGIQDNMIEITGDDLLDMELSFAITTHKSQGSECDIAVVIVPANPRGMLDRSIIYVAST